MFKHTQSILLLLLYLLTGPGLAGSQTIRYSLAEKNWLNQHKALRVGVVELTPPLLFYAGGHNPKGLVADYLRALALHLGMALEISRYEDREQLLAALEAGEVDVLGAWAVGLDKAESVIPTRPYLGLPLALYGREELPGTGLRELRGKSLAVLQGGLARQLAGLAPGLKVSSYATLEQALRAASDGEVDAYLGDAASADYLLKRQSFGDLEKQRQLALTYDLALAARKPDAEVLGLLQKGLDRIGPDELQEIWHRWPGVERPREYTSQVSPLFLWIPLMLIWSGFLVWGVRRFVVRQEQRHHVKLKRAIRRLQRRERALKAKLLTLKQKTLACRGENRQHRERLNLIDQVMPSGAWVWLANSAQCDWDEGMYLLFRQDPDSFDPTPESIVARVHEEDRERVAELFHQPEGERESRLSFRLQLPDGETRWLIGFSHYSSSQSGEAGQRTGLCWDITDYIDPPSSPAPVES